MNNYIIRDNLKLIVKYILRFVLKAFWVFPIKHNRAFFMANMGKGFLCNPKYLYKSMINDSRFENYEFIWCFVNPDSVDISDFSGNTVFVKKTDYMKYFYYLLTSGIIVYNCGGFSYAPIRKTQYLIETWHGGGAFKKVGLAVGEKSASSKQGIKLAMKDVKLFLSSCQMATTALIREAMGYEGKIIKSGFPRNDIFFNCKPEKIFEIREKLKLNSERVILYAPTFRGDEGHAKAFNEQAEVINPLDIKKAFSERFGGEWKFYTRGHQYSNSIKLDGMDGDWSGYPDMQELLLIADVLITDYSSSIWDFAITGKMCFLYVPDLEQYNNSERGFLTPFNEWPGIIVTSNKEFVEKIQTYNEQELRLKIDSFMKNCGSYENGNACELVKNEILIR